MNVAIYTRRSKGQTPEAAQTADLAAETASLFALARGLGATSIMPYHDAGPAGRPTSRRPGYRRLIEDIRSGWPSVVLASSLTRFGRLNQDLAEFVDALGMAEVTLRTIEEGRVHVVQGSGGTSDAPSFELVWVPRRIGDVAE